MNGNCIAPRQAGPEVLALLKDDEFLAFMSMGGLWDVSQSVVGAIQLPGNLVSQPFFEKETRSKDAAASFFFNGDLAEISRYLAIQNAVVHRAVGSAQDGCVQGPNKVEGKISPGIGLSDNRAVEIRWFKSFAVYETASVESGGGGGVVQQRAGDLG
ncbi:hypothetical protein B0H14DRAFT_2639932 [Mycena olivaceomarginata]|nr:hypothetical protein B0H14DRAFT_2639932 [Mycena olivaceomarginata]